MSATTPVSKPRRVVALSGVVAALAVAFAGMSVLDLVAARGEAKRAAEDLADVRAIARQIERLRAEPTVASAQAMETQRLGERIDAAANRARLDRSRLEGVFPQSPRRVGQTPYRRVPTDLALRGVELTRLTELLYHLTDDTGLRATALRLRPPPGDGPSTRWDADATVTYLVYQPDQATDRRD